MGVRGRSFQPNYGLLKQKGLKNREGGLIDYNFLDKPIMGNKKPSFDVLFALSKN